VDVRKEVNQIIKGHASPEAFAGAMIAGALLEVADALRTVHPPHLCGLCGKVVVGDGDEEE
jgi:hypothetical protein